MSDKYKLLILDIDGTLTNSRKEISPFTRQTLINAQEAGLRLVLASGRPVQGIMPLVKALEMKHYNGFMLAFNGGKIIDCHQQKVIYEQALPKDIIPILYKRSTAAGASILSYHESKVISETPDNEYVKYAAFLNKMEIQSTDNFIEDLPLPADKCLAVGKPELIEKLEEEMKKDIGDRINIYRSEAFFLELVPKGIDKAASIARLLKEIGIDREEVIAIGDGFNDLSMIRYAGLGVAMNNAKDCVKQEADIITTKTNEEDGIAFFLLNEINRI